MKTQEELIKIAKENLEEFTEGTMFITELKLESKAAEDSMYFCLIYLSTVLPREEYNNLVQSTFSKLNP